jgi:hypothetical protein
VVTFAPVPPRQATPAATELIAAAHLDGVKRKGRNRVSPPIATPRDDPNIDRADIASITSEASPQTDESCIMLST